MLSSSDALHLPSALEASDGCEDMNALRGENEPKLRPCTLTAFVFPSRPIANLNPVATSVLEKCLSLGCRKARSGQSMEAINPSSQQHRGAVASAGAGKER